MSAAELREAATKMRKRAEAAGPGAYGFSSAWTTPNTMLTRITRAGKVIAEKRGRKGDTGLMDMNHLSYWHPAVALAVADLLDEQAAVVGISERAGLPVDHDARLFMVARTYLGRTS